jgi:hypothetical protein
MDKITVNDGGEGEEEENILVTRKSRALQRLLYASSALLLKGVALCPHNLYVRIREWFS